MAEFILIDEHANKYGDSKKAIPLFIAPLTAFAGPSPPATAAHKSGLQAAAAFSLPLSWDIRNQGTVTGKGQKGRAFHPIVRNQLQCGSCWAHAIAEVASDFLSLYAESEKDDQVSVTSVILNSGDPLGDEGSNVLSKMFPRGTGGNAFNNGCCGGDCRAAVIFLSSTQYPLAFESCNDYTWMRRTCGGKTPVGPNKKTLKPSSSTCTSPMTNYFNQAAADFLTGNVEGGIPLDGKNGRQACYYDNSKHSLVRIQGPLIYSQGSVTVLVESEANPSHFNPNSKSNSSTSVEASQNQQLIKKHLYTTGSVAVMFAVLNDFVTGGGPNQKNVAGPSAFNGQSSWKKMANGKYVYIENRSQAKLAGAHAVVVMGWGVSKVDSNTTPYWIVRNSWGPGWNDQGYFNIAMYPINIMCQFSREWNRFSPAMLPSGTLGGLPNGRGYSGVFVSFKTVVTPASAVPVLPSWDKMTAEKLKNELDVSCDNNVLNGESPSSWIAFHQTDTHKPFGKPTTATKSTTTKTGEGILSFFEKHVVITIIVIIMIVAGLGFLLF